MDKYLDPPNALDIIEDIKKCKTIGEVKNIANKIFPGWIITYLPKYCDDYPHLTDNWNVVSKSIGIEKQSIIIVDDIFFDKSCYSVITIFSECFTRAGFLVRKKNDYFPCMKCKSAIPSLELWNFFKRKEIAIPDTWSSTCKQCQLLFHSA
jgi:hypothetical protein